MNVLRIAVGPVVGLVVGVVVGALGSVAYWGHRPWGLVVGLVLVLASATMMRAWAGRTALAGQVVGLGAVLVVLSRPGPGGDVLIDLIDLDFATIVALLKSVVVGDVLPFLWVVFSSLLTGADPGVFGWVWVAGSVVTAALVAVAPAVLFSDRPAGLQVHGAELARLGELPGRPAGGGLPAGSADEGPVKPPEDAQAPA
ncbi:MAG: hypothetical protein FWH11_05745 [Micrococcales bacterium]|nr:hypothetical protein [Micrococcales bacterium]